jgi:hypothetical protein
MGLVSIEHEDTDWGWPASTIAQHQDGLLDALRVLTDAGATAD